ncbi:MAG: FAD-dependent oxidoreductase [Planctomycetes bacterium]|nr:FAD-dependent oxidoreductase [Planctomycetota bacterium]
MRAAARSVFLLLALTTACATGGREPSATHATHAADIVIYGCTSAGIAAAVQARRMGCTVVVVGPDRHLGGLSAGGLGWTDSGNKAVIGGIAREFYQRVFAHYADDAAWRWQRRQDYGNRGQGAAAIDGEARTMWIFEPHVAEQVFEDLVAEHGLAVHRDQWLDRDGGVELRDGRITAIRMLSGRRYEGARFVDATYEGDLMAAAGVGYVVGREANSRYGETLNGVQTRRAVSHQFDRPVDPYVVPGDPSSGLLPRIHGGAPGVEGSGDHRVQAYCFRTCMTDHPGNRVPFPRPAGYDAREYELLLRYLQTGGRGVFDKFDPIPNRKTDTNNHGAFSFDNIGRNYDYPDADYARRREIVEEHRVYQQGLLWFLANDPRVPADVRERMSRWGLAADEFVDNAHWPHQLYVREARRMVADWVQTERHLRGAAPTPRPIGMGSYNMDSHNVQRYVDEHGHARNEGDIQVHPGGPYPVDYGAITPKRSECRNLLVPVCLSSSHIAYGSIRMEPVFMILGQSAATAAALSIEQRVAVQDLDYQRLAARLRADGQVLAFEDRRFTPLTALSGTVVDDSAAALEGPWQRSRVAAGVHRGYLHDGDRRDGSCIATFSAELAPGRYEVQIAYTAHANRAGNVRVQVTAGREPRTYRVDQRRPPNGEHGFHTLATSMLAGPVEVRIDNAGADGHVIVDAVRFVAR